MQARRANSDRVTSARAAALSMLAMSSSENQNETTRPMGRHIRTALVGISTAAFVLAGCAVRDVKHEVVEVDGHTFMCSYTESRINGNQADPQCVEIHP